MWTPTALLTELEPRTRLTRTTHLTEMIYKHDRKHAYWYYWAPGVREYTGWLRLPYGVRPSNVERGEFQI